MINFNKILHKGTINVHKIKEKRGWKTEERGILGIVYVGLVLYTSLTPGTNGESKEIDGTDFDIVEHL